MYPCSALGGTCVASMPIQWCVARFSVFLAPMFRNQELPETREENDFLKGSTAFVFSFRLINVNFIAEIIHLVREFII